MLLDLNVGMNRTGVAPGPEAARLARRIAASPALAFGGLHAYDGHLTDADHSRLVEKVEAAFAPVWRQPNCVAFEPCRVLGFARSSFRYKSRRNQRAELRLRDLAASRVHCGYQRLWLLLRREGWPVNKKLVYRLYCEECPGIRRRKPRRRKSVQVREARPTTGQTNESWSTDFMSDQLVGGQRFRLLT